jgi:non-ribosomal peptide synthetase component F
MQGFWDVFLERVRQNPAAIALIDGDKKISYAELQERAAAIGGVLRRKGAIPEKLIGLRLEKSAEYIIAMLGVWHAGAAFVPLPPSLPKERADYIAMQAGITDFLEAKDLVNLPACPDAPATLQENQLAYVIYTSGIDGQAERRHGRTPRDCEFYRGAEKRFFRDGRKSLSFFPFRQF